MEKNPPANARNSGLIYRSRRSLEESMAIRSSIPAWRIPWTEEPGSYSSQGHKRVRQDLVTKQQQQFLITLEIRGYRFIASFAQCEKKFLSYFASMGNEWFSNFKVSVLKRMSLICSLPISLYVSFLGRGGAAIWWRVECRVMTLWSALTLLREAQQNKLLFKSALLEPISLHSFPSFKTASLILADLQVSHQIVC